MSLRRGGCLCGQVRYEVVGEMRPVIACHCTQCRRTSGHHVAATSAPRGAVTVTGEVRWHASSEVARRGFCPTCGSNLFWDGPGSQLAIMAGTLEAPTGLALAGHIYAGDKGDYYEIVTDLPVAEKDSPGLTTRDTA